MAALQEVLTDGIAALNAINSGKMTLDDFLDNQLQFPERRKSSAFLLGSYFRHRNYLHNTLARYATREPGEPTKSLLLLTLTLMFYSDALQPEKVANAAVDIATKNTKGFLNAVLRRALVDFKLGKLGEDISPAGVLPREIYRHWGKFLTPAQLAEQAKLFLAVPPFTFRARITPLSEEEMTTLEAHKLEKFKAFHFYHTGNPSKVLNSQLLKTGRIYIQDPATSIASELTEKCGSFAVVLDFCAAPGGKSLMLLEKLPPEGVLYAYEFSPARKKLLEENFRRSQVDPRQGVIVDSPEQLGEADLTLADVPCSNSGVFRRRPDALWRWNARELEKITDLQQRILCTASKKVKPNGFLIYSTCSIDPAENEEQIRSFLSENPTWQLVEETKLLPAEFNDGAYAALLKK